MGSFTPEQRLEYYLQAKLKKAIDQWALIEDGDRILIGLSGGKDSLALVELMAERMRIFVPKFELHAAHIVMRNIPYSSDIDFLREHCESRSVVFHRIETEFDPTVDAKKSACFLCSWYRRKALFEAARSLGCNKVALGHHQDDILVTLLLNMTYQGSFSTMPVKLKMDKFDLTIIRPMALIKESDVAALAQLRQWKKQPKDCPYERDSHRSDMKALLAHIESQNPQARHHLWNSMRNVRPDYLL